MAVGQRQQRWLTHRIGGKPPPTFVPGSTQNTGRLQGRRAFAFDLRHTEPKRGAEWWGKSVLLTFALFKSEPL
jgi:hypothetical protein